MARVAILRAFDTREAAEAFEARTLTNYDPCGYGTRLSVDEARDPFGRVPPSWVVSGSRHSSCD